MLCDYGCGKEAFFRLKNGKYCCSKSCNSCPAMRVKNSESNMGRHISLETREKLRRYNLGKTKSSQTLEKHRISSRNTIEKIKKKYPFFSKIEEMRYNPDKPGEKEIQVHCKNHLCENSKERGGWFAPSFSQLAERIRQLESPDGNEGSCFYCSQECKDICPIYKSQGSLHIEIKRPYTQEEYNQFREYVLHRDNYECQYCEEKAEHIHHERPQKLEPFFSLDPDLAWSVCKSCHYKYGHKDECSTSQLAKIKCERK
jgi:5-methylcytosine-specific restriction endonuclease McrA